ncbi:hypothetical protein TNCV_4609081 [Trichonephila clavipes]|nr:hypothetical protein TNCV_4609081 [Trichonephila clavipes]
MADLGHQFVTPRELGRVDEEITSPGGQTFNQHLYFHILAEHREKEESTRNEEGQVINPPPRQCAVSFSIVCQDVSCLVKHPSAISSIFFL